MGKLAHLKGLELSGNPIEAKVLSQIAMIDQLEKLNLDGLGNADISPLAKLKTLQLLHVNRYSNGTALHDLRQQLPNPETMITLPDSLIHSPSENALAEMNKPA